MTNEIRRDLFCHIFNKISAAQKNKRKQKKCFDQNMNIDANIPFRRSSRVAAVTHTFAE